MKTRLAFASLIAVLGAACGGDGPAPATSDTLPTIPTGTDVFLGSLVDGPDGAVQVGALENVTVRAGYDNQPYFTPDGSGFWYTVNDDHSGQADIYRYDIGSESITRVTTTVPESEYSATPIPDGSGVSVIRVEADSVQRLWRIPFDGSRSTVILPALQPVGYHKWADAETLVMFVLGSPPTLRVGHPATGRVETVAERIGRSIQNIPGTTSVSFVQMGDEGTSRIMRLDPRSGAMEPLVDGVEGGDFHTWTPSGTLLQGHESKLFAWRPGAAGWTEVADFTPHGIVISRLAVSRDGTHIAIVGEAR